MSNVKLSSSEGGVRYEKLAQDDLTTSLTAPDPEDVAKPAVSVPMIEIVAPATLVEGYELETQVGDRLIKVAIPPGGVEKGQKFTVPVPASVGLGDTDNKMRYQVPVGNWKDGLCDCCQYGCFHATCCWGFSGFWCLRLQEVCCFCLAWPALGAAQVATRMNLDWLGRPVSNNNLQRGPQKSAFYQFGLVAIAFVGFQFTMLVLLGVLLNDVANHPTKKSNMPYRQYSNNAYNSNKNDWDVSYSEPSMPVMDQLLLAFYCLCNLGFFILCFVIICRVRRQVREKYSIPDSTGLDDCMNAVFCPCCTASQMMRHTGDYENYPASCCSSTGHPEWVNASIV